MADAITIKALQDASLDAKSLEEVVNGNEVKQVTTRKGETYPSVKKAIKTLFENGGLPATPFETKALMEASLLTDGSYAYVTNEVSKKENGLYVKKLGVWGKSPIDVANRLSVAEIEIFGGTNFKLYPEYSMSDGGYTTEGWVYQTADYHRTSPIYLKEATRIQFDCYGYNVSAITLIDADNNVLELAVIKYGTAENENELLKVDYTTREAGYYVISAKKTVAPFSPIFTLTKALSLDEKIEKNNATTAAPLENEIKAIESYLSNTTPVLAETQSGGFFWMEGEQITDIAVQGIEVLVPKNSTLSFDYTPIDGVSLWLFEGQASDGPRPDINKGIPLLWGGSTSNEVKSYKYKSSVNSRLRIVNTVSGSVKINGELATYSDLGSWGIRQYPSDHPYPNIKRTVPFDVQAGDIITITKAARGTSNILRNVNGRYESVLGVSLLAPEDTSISWYATKNETIRISGHADSDFLIDNSNSSLEARLDNKLAGLNANSNLVPNSIIMPKIEYVFATAMNYVLKTETINDSSYIKISQDLGKTWTQIPNILGDIVAYHFFSDGTIMLCSPQKVYWTDDYLTLNEATVYDHDGSVFVPTSRHFFAMQTGDKLDFVGDTEIHSWGDYHVDGTPARIWYTTDNGRTIKCSARFGVTDMGGVVRSIRHIHRVYYHQKTDYWYVTTGDFGAECMIIRGRYTPSTDTWAWEVLNSGIYYKFGNIMIDDDNMAFMITDYTEASQAEEKGIYRVHASNLGDFSKYRMIYKAEPSEWGSIAPVSLLLDPNGNKVILPDWLGSGYIWVASEGLDFKRVTVSPNVLLTYTLGENYNGDIYCVAYEGGNNLRLSSGSYNLTKALRNAGMSNFMRGSTLITGLKTVVS